MQKKFCDEEVAGSNMCTAGYLFFRGLCELQSGSHRYHIMLNGRAIWQTGGKMAVKYVFVTGGVVSGK